MGNPLWVLPPVLCFRVTLQHLGFHRGRGRGQARRSLGFWGINPQCCRMFPPSMSHFPKQRQSPQNMHLNLSMTEQTEPCSKSKKTQTPSQLCLQIPEDSKPASLARHQHGFPPGGKYQKRFLLFCSQSITIANICPVDQWS